MVRTFAFVSLLAGILVSRLVLADDASTTPTASTNPAHQTVERAIGYLQTESAAWLSTRKCAACHHVPMALWALAEADRRGYAIDKKFLSDTAESTLGSLDKMMASGLVPNPANPPDTRPMASGVNMGQVFMAVAAQSLPSLEKGQKDSLSFITDEIVKKQRADGSWEFFLSRPPINESQTTDAVWIILALQGDAAQDTSEPRIVALKNANAWLANTKLPDNLQDKAFNLLLASRAGKSREDMQSAIDDLFSRQRPDGGWSQLPEMTSDAYATGQTLYALALAGCTAEQPEIKRGIDFLVTTQAADGSWPMTSRSTPDGSPGSSTLLTPITCGAAAWSTLGLATLAPKVP
jgi:hypothetical protein